MLATTSKEVTKSEATAWFYMSAAKPIIKP